MKRRNFLAGFLGLFGVGAAGAAPLPAKAYVGELKVGETLKPYRTPKLRVWTLGDLEKQIYPTEKSVGMLHDLIKNWDGISDLDIIWGPELSVQQFDLHRDDVDAVVEQGQATIENVQAESDGSITARVIIEKPRIRIVKPGDSSNGTA
jgi:hypothetical protein